MATYVAYFFSLIYNKSMKTKSDAFIELAKLFSSHNYRLYLVGGTVRDILLGLPLTDMDAVTDATPEEMKTFLEGDYTFAKMGSVKIKYNDVKFDITTLRKETGYVDHRHPGNVVFIKDIKLDHIRRDFTINAMYMDEHFKLYDFENGLDDLNNHVLKMVGNPTKRLKEDPLRIIRCLRFSLTYQLAISPSLEKALMSSIKFLESLSKDKIKMELKKFDSKQKEEMEAIFEKYSIKHLLDMLE